MGEVNVYGTIRVLLKRVSNRDNKHISQDNTQHSKFMDIATTTVVFLWKHYGEEAGGRGGGGEEGRRSQEECDSPPTDELGSGKSAPPHSSAVTSGAPQ